MAKISLNSFAKNNQRKNVSVGSAKIYPAKLDATYSLAKAGELAVGDVVTLFSLPMECVITDCFLVVRTAPTGDSQQAQIQVKADNTAILDAVAVGATSGVVGSLKQKTYIPAGAEITATISTKALKDGILDVVVEFFELDRANGEYLN